LFCDLQIHLLRLIIF